MKRPNYSALISWLTAGLVAILALLAFILSYNSLQHLAAQNGLPGWLSYIWPLLLDFAMVVFSLAILRANLLRERAIYPWSLTIVFAGLATVANILDVTSLGLPPVIVAASVKALAPIALVLAFELLMSMLRAEAGRAAAVQSLAEMQADLNRRRSQLDDIIRKTEQQNALLENLKTNVSEARRVANRRSTAEMNQAKQAKIEARRQQVLQMAEEMSRSEMAAALGVSVDTIGRDLKALNGSVAK